MNTFFHQLKLLLWKNFLLRKRHKVRIVLEILWPLVLFIILMWVRSRGLREARPACHLIEKSLPSVGGFEFMQNFVCTINNACNGDLVEDNLNGGRNLWANASLPKLISRGVPILNDLVGTPQDRNETRDVFLGLSLMVRSISLTNLRKEISAAGDVKLESFLVPGGSMDFMLLQIESQNRWYSMNETFGKEILQTIIHLDKFTKASFDLADGLFQGVDYCGKQQGDLFTMNDTAFNFFCGDTGRTFLIHEYLKGKVDNTTDLYKKLSKLYHEEEAGIKDFNPLAFGLAMVNYSSTFRKLQALASFLGDLEKEFPELNNMEAMGVADNTAEEPNDKGTAAMMSMLSKAFCGLNIIDSPIIGSDKTNSYDSLRDRLRDWRNSRGYVEDDVPTVCNTVFRNLEERAITSLIWKQIKPFIRGRILYYPETAFTNALMKRVDGKFSEFKTLEEIFTQGLSIIHRLRLWFDKNKDEMKMFQALLKDDAAIEALLGPTLSTVFKSNENLQSMISAFTSRDLTRLEANLERMDFGSELESQVLSCFLEDKSKPNVTQDEIFKSEDEAVRAGMTLMLDNNLWAVIVFEDVPKNGSEPMHLKYKIRMDSDKVDGTASIRDRSTKKGPRQRPTIDLKYITNGFVYIQEAIEHSFIEMISNEDLSNVSMVLQQFPYPCYIYDQFIKAISNTFPMFMILSWVYASAMLIKSIVYEKELRLKEVMRVMGCGNLVIWTAWFIDSFVMMSIPCLILAIILKFGKVVENSDFGILLMFLLVFAVATICFSFLISTFFTKANSAAATGGILFFLSFLPYNFMLLWEERLTWYHTLFSCIISNVAFGFGCNYIARLEEDGVGARWDRISMKTLPGDDFSFIYCVIMLLFDSVLYFLLTLYIETVFPGENGMPKKWYFLFQRSFWFPKADNVNAHSDGTGYREYVDLANRPIVEADPEGMVCGVSVQHLCKEYSNGRVALSDLNMSFYEGQITSFLGHNGAGKTTTISILTGLFPPTEGTAFIYGYDIRKDMNMIRHDLGICPQHNVLFDRLNVEEHLLFYAGLKGKEDIAKKEMDQMLVDLGIPHKKREFPGNLSGGMKRKLSVAIAFAGGSRTVFLDEPTSGVDPYSRRSIWELLLHYKEGRTIILTTHFMDEADILGDRIAIISRGRLKACGGSLFLKAQFGQGYFLRLVREIEEHETDELMLNNFPPTRADDTVSRSSQALTFVRRTAEITAQHAMLFSNFIQHRIPEAQLMTDAGSDLIFLLPSNRVSEFQHLFQDLDEHMTSLRLQSYGISDTSLEDVFLRITIEDLEERNEDHHVSGNTCHGRCCAKIRQAIWRIRKRRKKASHHTVIAVPADMPSQTKLSTRKVSPEIVHRVPPLTSPSQDNITPEPERSLGSPIIPVSNVELPQHVEVHPGDSTDTEAEGNDVPLTPSIILRKESGLFGIKRDNIRSKFWIQIWVIVLKRFRNSNRNKKAIFFEIIFPALFIALMLASTLILPTPANEDSREVTFTAYPSPSNIFFSLPSTNRVQTFDDTVNQLTGPYTLGNPCVSDVASEGDCDGSWTAHDAKAFLNASEASPNPSLGTCTCATGTQKCDSDIEHPPPPKMKTRTDDFILDVSKYHVSDWIIKTFFKYEPNRLGGYEMFVRSVANYTMQEFLTLFELLVNATDANKTDAVRSIPKTKAERPDKSMYKIWFENRAWLSSTAYLNALNNLILRQQAARHVVTSLKDVGKYGITLYTHPMNLTDEQMKKESLKTAALGVVHAICTIFALSFVPASFTVYLIEERKSGAKHLHLISGVKPITYWVSNFCFDLLKYLFSIILCLILFYIFDAQAYISNQSVGPFLTLLILYGWAAIPLMYPASYIFGVPSTAFVVLACLNLFVGIITTVSTFVLDQLGDEELTEIGEMLQKLFLIFPQYCLGRGLMELVKLHLESAVFRKFDGNDLVVDRFQWKILGKLLLCLTIHGACFFGFTILVEYRQWAYMWLCKKRLIKKEQRVIQARMSEDSDDEDVQKEAIRVTEHPPQLASLLAQNLGKIYNGKKRPAVNNLCFAVDPGECFGLLGINGAGKSTTFKMLTGDVRITSGKAYIMGWDIEKNLDDARKHYGYCPQEDGIDPLLNSYEQLELYGRLRGLTVEEVRETSNQLITALGLTRYASKRCGTYSGGNKRKISTAVALIGNPDVLFLDEPTSGMDPGARRQLWKLVIAVIHLGKAVVLTSHSMEECEALCSRLAIMVNGKFTCLGSLQHLKNRFGKGYRLTVRCPVANQAQFLASLKTSLPFAKLEDTHSSQLKFDIPQEATKLSDIFSVMCILRTDGLIEDFSVSQTTLDDIFIKFASAQRDELDGKPMAEKDPPTAPKDPPATAKDPPTASKDHQDTATDPPTTAKDPPAASKNPPAAGKARDHRASTAKDAPAVSKDSPTAGKSRDPRASTAKDAPAASKDSPAAGKARDSRASTAKDAPAASKDSPAAGKARDSRASTAKDAPAVSKDSPTAGKSRDSRASTAKDVPGASKDSPAAGKARDPRTTAKDPPAARKSRNPSTVLR